MNLMNKYHILFLLTLSGCGSHVVFEPDHLPNAHIGKVYSVPVNIVGGNGPVVDLSYNIVPIESGIKLKFEDKRYYTEYIYNNFIIEGTPKAKDIIELHLEGGIVGSAGETFHKDYKIKVTD